jgi:RIO-like serine/threonine protein kinase
MVRSMDATDKRILKAIDKASPKSFVSPVKVNEVRIMDTTQLGDRLMLLKESGYVDVMTSEYASSLTLPNAISRIHLTNLGRQILKKRK